MKRVFCTCLVFLLVMAPGLWAMGHTGLPYLTQKCGHGVVAQVLTGDLIKLVSGEKVKLDSIKAPEYWPKGSPYNSWPNAFAAKKELSNLIERQDITLFCFQKKLDHRGIKHAHVKRSSDDLWIQDALTRSGYAWVFGGTAPVSLMENLREAETDAQSAHKGIWSNSAYAAVPALDLEAIKPGWFQLIKGTVVAVASIRGTYYLNFGSDWREDFTIQLSHKLAEKYASDQLNIASLQGKIVEVRGFVEWAGGPKIIVTDRHQIRLLNNDP